MNREQEVAAINAWLELRGAYRARMGECYYGDEAVPLKHKSRYPHKSGKIKRKCEGCGGVFYAIRPSDKKRFCNAQCYNESTRKPPLPERACAFKKCGKMFVPKVRHREQKYCTHACGVEAQRRENR